MAIRTNWASGDVLTAVDLNDTFADARTNATNLTAGTMPIARIADGAITAAKLGSNSVETAKINAGAVTTAKIGDGQVTAAKLDTAILDGTWSTPTIAANWEHSPTDQPLRYKKIGNILYINGAVRRTGAGLTAPTSSVVTTLPAGFRPANRVPLAVVTFSSGGAPAFTHNTAATFGLLETDGDLLWGSNDGSTVFNTGMQVAFSAVVVV